MQQMMKYTIAAYLRLSIEDDGETEESNSITSQRLLIREYIQDHFAAEDIETLEFCDDGYSGTNMNRPGIQSLLDEVKKNRIRCIIVKDISRFSRDYIDGGTYLDQIFPFMGVRFIGINDGYDSSKHKGSTIEIDTAFQTLLYDLYSKDTSAKVKAAFDHKYESGLFLSACVPFGYKKIKGKEHRIEIEPEKAAVVRRIFDMALEGLSSSQIALKLHQDGVPTPQQMRNIRSCRESVRPVEKVVRYGPKRKKLDLSKRHPLVGIMECGGCGAKITHTSRNIWNGKRYSYFACLKKKTLQNDECADYTNIRIVEELVLKELNEQLKIWADAGEGVQTIHDNLKAGLGSLKKELSSCEKREKAIRTHIRKLYQEYFDNALAVNEILRTPIDFCNPTVPVSTELVDCVNSEGHQDHVLLMHIEASPLLHANQADEAYIRVGDKSKLFGKNPQQFFPRAFIRFIRYDGTEARVGKDMNVVKDVIFEGRILEQVEKAIDFIKNQMKEKTYLGHNGIFVTEEEYSEFVRTEIVVNAATHRDYSIKGTDIQIKMFDDRLEVDSPGTFAGMVRKENIRYTHFSRNPKIAAFLKDYGYVKEYGEGVDRMCRELEAAGLLYPVFDNNTFILKTTVMSATFEKSAVQTEKISGLKEKSAVDGQKIGDSEEKPAVSLIEYSVIADLCTEKGYSRPTIINIETLYNSVDVNQIFGAAYVRKTLSCADSTARSLIGKLRDMGVVVSVTGKGKGMYRFKYSDEM